MTWTLEASYAHCQRIARSAGPQLLLFVSRAAAGQAAGDVRAVRLSAAHRRPGRQSTCRPPTRARLAGALAAIARSGAGGQLRQPAVPGPGRHGVPLPDSARLPVRRDRRRGDGSRRPHATRRSPSWPSTATRWHRSWAWPASISGASPTRGRSSRPDAAGWPFNSPISCATSRKTPPPAEFICRRKTCGSSSTRPTICGTTCATPRFRALMRYEIGRAEGLYFEAMELERLPRARRPGRLRSDCEHVSGAAGADQAARWRRVRPPRVA